MIAARAGQVGVNVHSAGHHDHPACVERRRGFGQARHDPAVFDADVPDLSVHRIGRVVYRPPYDPKAGWRAHAGRPSLAATRMASADRVSTAGR
jgi:hypothetical protein